MSKISEAMEAAQSLLEIDGVVGVGEGEAGGQPCVLVFVTHRRPELEKKIPRAIKGVPVEIRDSGPISATRK